MSDNEDLRTRIISPTEEKDGSEFLIPTVTITKGPRIGSLHRFNPRNENILTIGRTKDAEFVIVDPTLSRVHAKMTWMPVGREYHMLLEDLGSTNGTYVNNEKVDATFLKDGDHIRLGDVGLRFQCLNPQELAERDRLITKATEAEKDHLTGLANRRYMEDNLPQLLKEADLRGMPVTLLVLDLDHFKRINDSYGHQSGDEVLRITSAILQEHIRASDIGVRFGGEEFLIFLPGSKIEGAHLVAERIRQAIYTRDCSHINPQLNLSVSIGVTIRVGTESYEQMIERADKALYAAKHGGRNRVVVDKGEEAAAPPS